MSLRDQLPPRIVLGISAVLLVVLMILTTLPVESSTWQWMPAAKRKPVDLGTRLMGINVKDLDLSEVRNKVVFINFWATWCGPCRKEMPSMVRLHEEFSDSGLMIVAVTNEPKDTVEPFLKKNPYPFAVVSDDRAALMRRFRIRTFPTTLIVDRKGRLAYQHIGSNDWSEESLLEAFRRLLAE